MKTMTDSEWAAIERILAAAVKWREAGTSFKREYTLTSAFYVMTDAQEEAARTMTDAIDRVPHDTQRAWARGKGRAA